MNGMTFAVAMQRLVFSQRVSMGNRRRSKKGQTHVTIADWDYSALGTLRTSAYSFSTHTSSSLTLKYVERVSHRTDDRWCDLCRRHAPPHARVTLKGCAIPRSPSVGVSLILDSFSNWRHCMRQMTSRDVDSSQAWRHIKNALRMCQARREAKWKRRKWDKIGKNLNSDFVYDKNDISSILDAKKFNPLPI